MSNVKFIYVYNGSNPRACIAYRTPEGTTPESIQANGTVTVEVGLARCHPKDNFVKAVARAKAGGRLQSTSYRKTITVPSPIANEGSPGSGQWWREFERDLLDAVQDSETFSGNRGI